MASTIFKVPASLITRQYDNDDDESLPFYRTSFMRDRDRVMYSTAFRRLAGKTQIYTAGIDDHRKNRLTHSLEVSEIARTVSKALGLDCDLTEAIALGHDLGHTPFGHAGEQMLHDIFSPGSKYVNLLRSVNLLRFQYERDRRKNEILEIPAFDKIFGFKHNIQSVRVACVLEDAYRNSDGKNIGLNLTNYTLWGILNHSKLRYNNNSSVPVYYKQFQKNISANEYQSGGLVIGSLYCKNFR